MNEVDRLPQTVKKRLVFYVSGFDPMPPNRYRELYRVESSKQSALDKYKMETNRIASMDKMARFKVDAQIDDREVESEFRFLQWNDLVQKEMQVSVLKSWLGMFKIAKVAGFSGALSRLLKLHFPPNIAGLYPFFMIPFQFFISLFLAIAVGEFIGGLELAIAPILGWIIGAALFVSMIIGFRRMDDKFMAYYMLHDLLYICHEDGYTPKSLRPRLEEFKNAIDRSTDEGFDEILVIGHSSGAHLAVIVLAELIRENRISASNNISLLTLGQAIPLISYLPGARDLRLALYEFTQQDVVRWVDFTAPSDGACFALHNPVTCSVDVEVNEQTNMPRVLSAAFRQYLSDGYYRKLRMRFFRLHFQYLCHFDFAGIYDYFRITAGPIRLWERFGHLNSSPSMDETNLNKFFDKAP